MQTSHASRLEWPGCQSHGLCRHSGLTRNLKT